MLDTKFDLLPTMYPEYEMLDFENKSIFFIGDSITANGSYLGRLRMHLKKCGRNIRIHNKGIPGASAAMSLSALDEVTDGFVPDYAVICLGVNDAGYWEYTSEPEISEYEAKMRNERCCRYISGIDALVKAISQKGICPILCSPFCTNRYFPDAKDIETVVDSKEKACIDASFYTRQTFEKINGALKIMGQKISEYSKVHDIVFWDLYLQTYEKTSSDSFCKDGIHYSEQGDVLIAKLFCRHITGENLTEGFIDCELLKLAAFEASEIAYYFVKYNIMGDSCLTLEDNELRHKVDRWLQKNGNINGLTKEREAGFFEFSENTRENKKNLLKLIHGC